jgi:hypothetical protein
MSAAFFHCHTLRRPESRQRLHARRLAQATPADNRSRTRAGSTPFSNARRGRTMYPTGLARCRAAGGPRPRRRVPAGETRRFARRQRYVRVATDDAAATPAAHRLACGAGLRKRSASGTRDPHHSQPLATHLAEQSGSPQRVELGAQLPSSPSAMKEPPSARRGPPARRPRPAARCGVRRARWQRGFGRPRRARPGEYPFGATGWAGATTLSCRLRG